MIADVFVGTLGEVITDVGISAVFLGLIIVPLVGNIAENIVGIKIAYQNDMDFSMLVSLGSSLQIALGVAPLLVFISLLTAHEFDLVFPPIQIIALVGRRDDHLADRDRRRVELARGRPAGGRVRHHRDGGVVPVSRFQKIAFPIIFAISALGAGRCGCSTSRGRSCSWSPRSPWPAWPGRWARRPSRPATSAGPRVSALLNASFGNLPEVVILVLAINAGLEDIARASIIGSVIGNILLILGLSLLLGGWRNGIQTFNQRVAGMNSSMLVLGVVGSASPTLFFAIEPNVGSEHILSALDGAPAPGLLRRLRLLLVHDARACSSSDEPGTAALVADAGDRAAGR